MAGMLLLDAFGTLSPGANLIDILEEDLYSVFRSRSELMGWYDGPSTKPAGRRASLWNMHEAELTAGDGTSRIGWVKVGLDVGDLERTQVPPPPGPGFYFAPLGFQQRSIEPAVILPALTHCFIDSLDRFGSIELTGLQVTAGYLEPGTPPHGDDLPSGHNWFHTSRRTTVDAHVAFSQELLANHDKVDLVTGLSGRRLGRFEFGPAVTVPEQHWILAEAESYLSRFVSPARTETGLSVRMPEWTASAVGWVLAIVFDAARAVVPDVPHFAVRVTRVR